nr:hypothetical protein [uncultured Pseudomonas sp.]
MPVGPLVAATLRWKTRLVALLVVLAGLSANAAPIQAAEPLHAPQSAATAKALAQPVQLLERPAVNLFSRRYTLAPEEFRQNLRKMAIQLGMAAVRRGKVKVTGPLTVVLPDLAGNSAQQLNLELGFPVSSGALIVTQHKMIREESSLVLSTDFDHQRNDVEGTWQVLFDAAAAQGLTPGNQGYVVIHDDGSERTEYQLVVSR